MNSIKINGVEIPLEKVCEECGGYGWVKTMRVACYAGEHTEIEEQLDCPVCEGEATTPIYYTPQQVEELTGEKLSDDTAVWVISWMELSKSKTLQDERYVSLDKLSEAIKYYNPSKIIFIAFPYQPAPPADYRVEENQ